MFFVGVFFLALGVLGKFVGMRVLAIKYTLYYIPFFCVGYLFGEFNDEINSLKYYKTISAIVVSFFAIAYMIMILQFNIQGMADTAFNIIIRIVISLSGCTVLFYVVDQTNWIGKVSDFLCHYGKHSLEIYLVHYCFLKFINTDEIVLNSVPGVIACIINYAVCLVCTLGFVYSVGKISYLNKVLFAKK
jgi:surface polysaccharide O-acyltransferase-like enzyme